MPINLTPSAKAIRFISMALFLISLALPCYDTVEKNGEFGQGAFLLISGILWFMFASPGFVWLANPLLILSWVNAGKNRDRSFVLSIIAVFFALCFLFYKDIVKSESGSTTPIIAHNIGYWLWVSSILTMLLGNVYLQLFGMDIEKPKSKFPNQT
jgi:hypothetical protein